MQTILGEGIYDVMKNGFRDGAKEALRAFVDMLARMSAEVVAADIARKLFGAGGVGSGGGWIGQLGSLFAGAFSFGGGATAAAATVSGSVNAMDALSAFSPRDAGGAGTAGRAYWIGTGAQPEMFVPSVNGRFYPRSQQTVSAAVPDMRRGDVRPAGGATLVVNQRFSVITENGERVSRRTEQQIAAAASRGVAVASKRNN
jgi:hypothetical protein